MPDDTLTPPPPDVGVYGVLRKAKAIRPTVDIPDSLRVAARAIMELSGLMPRPSDQLPPR